jgi:hypothetical protein
MDLLVAEMEDYQWIMTSNTMNFYMMWSRG